MGDDRVEPERASMDDVPRIGGADEDAEPGNDDPGSGLAFGTGVGRAIDEQWVFVVAFAVAAIGLPLVYLDRPLHFDEGVFLTVGEEMTRGATLYADIADHKPPGIYLVATAVYALGSPPILAARAVTYGLTAASGLLVVRLGRDVIGRRAAYGAGVLFVVVSYLPHFDGFYFLTEPYAVATMLVAAILLGRDSLRAHAAAGAALGIGVLFNQTVLLFGGAILIFHLVRLRYPAARSTAALRRTTTEILTIGVGFLVVMAVTGAALAAAGILRAAFYYAFLRPFTAYSTPFDAWGHVLALVTLLPVWLLTAGMVLRTGASVVAGTRVDDRLLFVAVWAAVMSVPGATGFAGDHKFLFAFPAAAILTIAGLAALYGEVDRLTDPVRELLSGRPDARVLLGGLLLAAVLSMAVVSGAGNVYYASNLATEDVADERSAMTEAVAGVDGPVYAYNVQAQLYVHTDVGPATTFMGTMYAEEIARQKVADLDRENVRYVLVKRVFVDDGRVVPGTYWPDHKAIMTAYLNAHFEPTRSTDEWVLFERTEDS